MRSVNYLTFLLLLAFIFPVQILAHSGSHTILVTENGFEPSELTIDQGETVEFVNTRMVPAWPASDIHPTHAIYSDFDPGQAIVPQGQWQFSFNQIGEWSMHDHLNPNTVGKIVVVGQSEKVVEKVPLGLQIKSKITDLKFGLVRLYYKLFPKLLDKKLAQTDMHEIAQDPEELEYYIRLLGGLSVMDELLADSGSGSITDCHQEAHNIGRVSYKVYGQDVFTYGNSACHSGFYHGAMEEFLKTEGTTDLANRIEEICTQFKTEYSKFECLHGVGHGVMAYKAYDLLKALEVCSQLTSDYDISSCYGGVFMENIVVAQGKGAIKAHETKWVSTDPHFPCNAVNMGTNADRECYMMQTSWMLTLFDGDFEVVAQECLKAPAEMIPTCFQSLGRDGAGYALRNPDKILAYCNLVPSDYFTNCLAGSLNVITEFWGEKLTDQGAVLCAKVEAALEKRRCFTQLGSKIRQIFPDDQLALKKLCGTFDDGMHKFCTGESISEIP